MKRQIKIFSADDFAKMRLAGKLAGEVLDYIADYVVPGVTTLKLNDLCHDFITKAGGIPAALNYRGFPKSVCTSVNHVVCHGIPGEKVLDDGDIVNIDAAVSLDGWYGDSSRMYYAGKKVSIKAQRLCQATYEAMMLGIECVRPGATFSEIGITIERYANKMGFTVVRDFCGHGVGNAFHLPPNVLHFDDKYDADADIIMEPGMIFTVEPMINAGRHETKVLNDGWTAVTRDRSLSAQFEHTIGVTENGYEIFTLSRKNAHYPVL